MVRRRLAVPQAGHRERGERRRQPARLPVTRQRRGRRRPGRQALANGDDILFTSADGTTKLRHEIESYDNVTGALRLWVKTDLSAGEDTVLYLYYGNGAATPQQDPTNVWDGNYVGVWHLDEAPDGNALTDEIIDSTANAQHGNTEGAIDATDLVAAKIGQGIDFDSVDAGLIRVADSAALDATAVSGTFELWINFDNAADGNHQIVMTSSNRYTGGAKDGFEWASQGDGDHFFYPWGGDDSNYNLGPNPFTNTQWHHLTVTFDHDQLDASIFVDGVEMSYVNENVPTYWTRWPIRPTGCGAATRTAPTATSTA